MTDRELNVDMTIASLRYDLMDLTTALQNPEKRRVIEDNRPMIELEINHFLTAFNADLHAGIHRDQAIRAERRAAS